MPYLRVTSPVLDSDRRVAIATALTDAVVLLFTPPRGPTAAQIRERTTVHFAHYDENELFIGGTASELSRPDVIVELSDWFMSVRQQRKVASGLTPLLVELFDTQPDSVNLRFHSYPPSAFAVGGQLLSDRLPRPGKIAKRLFG